ncbi:ATP-binding protein [Candidatus Tisiphia endosymbiont of Sialis lutaria]
MIAKRYEKGSVIITTNKTFENWERIFESLS